VAQDDSYDLAPPAPAPAPAPRQKFNLADRLCTKCGYNLRGLPKTHACPECGTLHKNVGAFNDQLQYGNPAWASRLAFGLILFLIGAVIFPAQWAMALGSDIPLSLTLAAGLAGSLLEFTGLWFFTSREPTQDAAEGKWALRRILRITALTTFAADLLTRAVALASLNGLLPGDFIFAALAAEALLLIFRSCVLGFYLHFLAMRIPDDVLSQRSLNVSWALVFTSPTLLIGLPFAAYILSGSRLTASSFFCSAVPLLPFTLVYLYGLWLLIGFVRDLRNSAREACRTMIPQRPVD
jgi:hypothetical protein